MKLGLFLRSAEGRYRGDALVAFLGTFFGIANLVGLAMQIFVVRWLLGRVGLLPALAVFPASLLLTPAVWAWEEASRGRRPRGSWTPRSA